MLSRFFQSRLGYRVNVVAFVVSLVIAALALAASIHYSLKSGSRLLGMDIDIIGPIDELLAGSDLQRGIDQYTLSLQLSGIRSPLLEERLAEKLIEHGHYESACQQYARADQYQADDSDFFQNYADCLWKTGQQQEAKHVAQRGLKLYPSDPFLLQLLGDFESERGLQEQAYAHYEQARRSFAELLAADSSDAVTSRLYRKYSLLLWSLGEREKAIQVAQLGCERFAGEYQNWSLLADLYRASGQIPLAIQYYEKVLEIEPEQHQVRQQLEALRQG